MILYQAVLALTRLNWKNKTDDDVGLTPHISLGRSVLQHNHGHANVAIIYYIPLYVMVVIFSLFMFLKGNIPDWN